MIVSDFYLFSYELLLFLVSLLLFSSTYLILIVIGFLGVFFFFINIQANIFFLQYSNRKKKFLILFSRKIKKEENIQQIKKNIVCCIFLFVLFCSECLLNQSAFRFTFLLNLYSFQYNYKTQTIQIT
jgi:hypothetical protein